MSRARPLGTRVATTLVVAASGAGCASLLGIDETYELAQEKGAPDASASGGRSTGGVKATGGEGDAGAGGTLATGGLGTGGAAGSGGEEATGGTSGETDGASAGAGGKCSGPCADGEKCCSSLCVPLSPLWGCSRTGCEPCSDLPDNAVGICDGESCDFRCVDRYERSGDQCVPVPVGSGGAPGEIDSGAPVCNPTECTGCFLPFYSPCCQQDGTCGCAWPASSCFPKIRQ